MNMEKDIKIVKETKDYLVIDKPAGLLVHGAKHITEETLVDWLLAKYPKIKEVGESLERPGIVHRLDKDVSGLMVIAKNQTTYEHLKSQFQDRTMTKEYTALVYGKILSDEGDIDFPIKRSHQGFKMAAVPKNFASDGETVRQALTHYQIIEKKINYTLLAVRIKTGRTHQIRVHLAALGHPIVGDNLYGTKTTKIKNKKIDLGRLFLVSSHLEFTDPDGKVVDSRVDLPLELSNFLKIAK